MSDGNPWVHSPWVPPFHGAPHGLIMCAHCSGMFLNNDHDGMSNHELFHQGLKETGKVSAVAWCDKGNHAFKAGEPGSQSGTMQMIDGDGRKVSVQFDTCAEHSFQPTTPAVTSSPSNLQ